MAKVSISEAAKMAGIARSNFYKNYIDTGKISITTDNDGKKKIDTSEILRVFGEIKRNQLNDSLKDNKNIHENSIGQYQNEYKILVQDLLKEKEARIQLLEKELDDSKKRESWLQEQLTVNIKLIEHIHPKQNNEIYKKRWWHFLKFQKTI